MAAILTLLTDFGTSDGYVGALKGAIARVAPELRVVTITHGIPPHDIAAGAYWLAASAPYFPPGTVHSTARSSTPAWAAIVLWSPPASTDSW